MTKIKCQGAHTSQVNKIKVRIIRAPLVNTIELNQIIEQRARAVVI